MSTQESKPKVEGATSQADKSASGGQGGGQTGVLGAVREKVLITLVGFLLTGVAGTMVTTWIQQRGWAWQNRVGKIDKDTQNILQTYRSAAELVNARWLASYEAAHALEAEKPAPQRSARWRAAMDSFNAADREWTLKFTNVAREIEFYVDTPFGVQPPTILGAVYASTCLTNPYDGDHARLDPRSARIALEIVNHCQARIRDDLAVLIDAAEKDGAPAPDFKAQSADAFRRLDVVYKVNDRLRCIIFERALAVRRQSSSESYWGTFFGVDSENYRLPPNPPSCAP